MFLNEDVFFFFMGNFNYIWMLKLMRFSFFGFLYQFDRLF